MWKIKNHDIEVDLTRYLSKEDFDVLLKKSREAPKKVNKTYYSKQIQKQADITENQIKHWTLTGVLLPYKAVRGTGKMHLYDHQNLIEAMICREFHKYSITHGLMKDILDMLRNYKLRFQFTYKQNESEPRLIKKISHTLWEYLRKFPYFSAEIHLVLWKDSYLPQKSGSESGQGTDDYGIDLIFQEVSKIPAYSASMLVISLTRLLEEAGDFCEEE